MKRRGSSLSPDTELATLRRYLKEISSYPTLTHEDGAGSRSQDPCR